MNSPGASSIPRPQPGPPPALPRGFRAAGIACGVKSDPNTPDLSIIVSDPPCAATGVFTQNRVVAAPVHVTRARVPSDRVCAVVINSGNANACTGTRGIEDAGRMTLCVAERLHCAADHVLVCSTGIIGARLPMEKIEPGIARCIEKIACTPAALESAARGMMTTDTTPKWSHRTLQCAATEIRTVGIAKGAAMIAPRMATMLAVVMTDAPLAAEPATSMLRTAVNRSFNCISVDGHTSTNDTVLLLANGAAPVAPEAVDAPALAACIEDVCTDLAKAIIADAEGAQHRITIDVQGARTEDEAQRIARAVADSPLVKCAIHGADPNWGRIVSAAGYAGVPFDEGDVSLRLNDTLLYERGTPVAFDAAAVSESLRSRFEAHIHLEFNHGPAAARFWSADLTEEYVRLNADYHT